MVALAIVNNKGRRNCLD